MPEELKLEYAIAVGDGSFPFHMLRYDQCFPNDDHSAWLMDGDEDETKRMVVLARHSQPGRQWTPKVWEHYGWTLDAGEVDKGFQTLEDAKPKMYKLFKEGCKGA